MYFVDFETDLTNKVYPKSGVLNKFFSIRKREIINIKTNLFLKLIRYLHY